jgi:hypothetical protein
MGGPINSLLRFVFDERTMPPARRVALPGRLWLQKSVLGARWAKIRGADRPFEKIL